jgi:hypothetical protein
MHGYSTADSDMPDRAAASLTLSLIKLDQADGLSGFGRQLRHEPLQIEPALERGGVVVRHHSRVDQSAEGVAVTRQVPCNSATRRILGG